MSNNEASMDGWDPWDIALLVGAAFVAVTTLVRWMLARREQLAQSLRAEMAAARRQQEKKAKKASAERKDEAA